MKKNRALLAQLVAAAVASSAVGVSVAHAETSFGGQVLSQGYMVVAQADAAKAG